VPSSFTPEATLSREERENLHSQGILPVTRSKRDFVHPSDYRYKFLVGNGESLPGCGRWMWRGCLEHAVDVAEAYKASCGRLSCPICYEKACGKEAVRIEYRISRFRLKNRVLKPIHVAVSPSELDIQLLSFSALRRKAEQISMKCGVIGGSIIFHPFRRYNEDDMAEDLAEGFDWKTSPACWYISPHFHIIGYGWIHHTKENYEATGWIVKNLRVRNSVRSTAHYQLSHCGISDRYHAVVWFGVLAYNKLKAGKVPDQKHLCPFCGLDLQKIEFVDPQKQIIVESSLEDECMRAYPKGTFRYVQLLSRLGDGGG
jgi:Valyl-tRNA synthetase